MLRAVNVAVRRRFRREGQRGRDKQTYRLVLVSLPLSPPLHMEYGGPCDGRQRRKDQTDGGTEDDMNIRLILSRCHRHVRVGVREMLCMGPMGLQGLAAS